MLSKCWEHGHTQANTGSCRLPGWWLEKQREPILGFVVSTGGVLPSQHAILAPWNPNSGSFNPKLPCRPTPAEDCTELYTHAVPL